jgi:hypothetical protein
MTTPRIARWTAKRLLVATIAVFVTGLALFYSQGLFVNEPVERARYIFPALGLTARVLMGVAVLLGVLAAARKAQEH